MTDIDWSNVNRNHNLKRPGSPTAAEAMIEKILRKKGFEIYEEPVGFKWVVIGPGDVSIPLKSFELDITLKDAQLKNHKKN